ncbi:MAG: flippase [Candidatus Moranbacteria bacterium]|nr:flippase [Candidatus Moranbacteria bacterium]
MIARKIAYNVVFNGITKFISIGLAIFSIGMLQHYLGVTGYGKYTTVLFYFALFGSVSDLGLHSIMTREISKKSANESEILSKIFTLRVLISFSVFLISLILIPLVSILFFHYPIDIQIGILIAGISFLLSSSYGLLNGLFQKKLAMDKIALTELAGKVIQAIIIILAVKLNKSFLFAVNSLLFSMVFNFIIIYFLANKFVKIRFIIDLPYWKKFLKKSLPLGIGAIATFCYFNIDTLLLGFFHTQEQVGIYGAAYKIIGTLVFFPAMVIGLVFPLFSRYINEKEKFNKIVNITFKFFIIIVTPLVVSVQFLADEIVTIIGGAEFIRSAFPLQLLIFALAFIFFGQLSTNILIAASKQKTLMKILIGVAIFNLSANIIFIPLYSYNGAALISVISEFLVTIISFFVLFKNNIYRPNVPKILFIFLAGIIMLSVYCFSKLFLPVTVILAVLSYFFILFIFKVISKSEIQQLLLRK